ncbi:MAG: hypothetical protein NZO16_04195 [Deltaproteobacteria bacterium]|nr:hypothetical protein [Deltaproteobacteria bacterium]
MFFLSFFLILGLCYVVVGLASVLLKIFGILFVAVFCLFTLNNWERTTEVFNKSYLLNVPNGLDVLFDKQTLAFFPLLAFYCFLANSQNHPRNRWLDVAFILSCFYSISSSNPLVYLIFLESSSLFLYFVSRTADSGQVSALRFLKYSVFSFSALVVAFFLARFGHTELSYWLAVFAIFAKAPLFPFNGWQIQAYSMCTPVSVFGMSSILSKLSLLYFTRHVALGDEFENTGIIVTSVAGLMAGLKILIHRDSVNRLALASSTHIALMFSAIIADLSLALTFFPIFVLGHGIVIGLLLVREKLGSQFSLGSFLATLALIGQPLSLIFWSDVGGLVTVFNSSTYCFCALAIGLVCVAWFGLTVLAERKLILLTKDLDFFMLLIFIVGLYPKNLQPEYRPSVSFENNFVPKSFEPSQKSNGQNFLKSI